MLRDSELQMLVKVLVSQRTEHAMSMQTHCVQADSDGIESKREQVLFHSRVLEHVSEPVPLDSMQ